MRDGAMYRGAECLLSIQSCHGCYDYNHTSYIIVGIDIQFPPRPIERT